MMVSPQGELLDIPPEGVPAMTALGWEPLAIEAPVKKTRRAPATPETSKD